MWSSFVDPFTTYDPFFTDPFFADPVPWPTLGYARIVDRSGDRRHPEQRFVQGGTPRGTAAAGGTGGAGQLTTTGATDVGMFDFNRLLNEPLNLGLEDHELEYQMHVRQPQGLRKKDLHVETNNGVLTISGEREREKTRRGERSYVSFQRSITIPSNVHADGISAQYADDGTLTIHLPKIPGTGKKRINIVGATEQSMERKESSEISIGKGGTEREQRKDSSAARDECAPHEAGAKTEPQHQTTRTGTQTEMESTGGTR